MKKTLIIIISFLIIANCLTTDKKTYYNTDLKLKEKIENIDKMLLEIKFGNNNKDFIVQVKKQITDLENSLKDIKISFVKILGLKGELELLQGNIAKVKNIILIIEKKYDKEELLCILKAETAKDNEEKEKILIAGLKSADTNSLIKLYLAAVNFEKQDFKASTSLYDEALKNLPEFYKTYYSKKRNFAYELINIKPKDKTSYEILIKDKITIEDAVRLILNETNLLDKINNKDKIEDIFNQLKTENYFYTKNNKLDLSGLIKRKDIAYMLVNILSVKNNNLDLLRKYNPYYSYSRHVESKSSLIKDIKVTDYNYNACMIAVEYELIDLPDGQNFFPEDNVGGIDFYNIINKLQSETE